MIFEKKCHSCGKVLYEVEVDTKSFNVITDEHCFCENCLDE